VSIHSLYHLNFSIRALALFPPHLQLLVRNLVQGVVEPVLLQIVITPPVDLAHEQEILVDGARRCDGGGPEELVGFEEAREVEA
jgi:hypothetical protein